MNFESERLRKWKQIKHLTYHSIELICEGLMFAFSNGTCNFGIVILISQQIKRGANMSGANMSGANMNSVRRRLRPAPHPRGHTSLDPVTREPRPRATKIAP